jgi:hypothetical protein
MVSMFKRRLIKAIPRIHWQYAMVYPKSNGTMIITSGGIVELNELFASTRSCFHISDVTEISCGKKCVVRMPIWL